MLILFLLHIAVPQDNASGDLITTELMHRMRLRRGGTQRFAINSQMRVISLPLWRVQSAWFRSTALLGFEAAQKRLARSHPGVWRPLSPARCSTSSGMACAFDAAQSGLLEQRLDVGSSPWLHSNSFVQPSLPGQVGKGSAPIRSVSLGPAVHQRAVGRFRRATS